VTSPFETAPVLPDSDIERVLVVSAHPDDHDFGAAGSIVGWVAAGIPVTILVLTDGQAGGFDDGIDRAEIPAIRRREQRAAAAVLGVSDVRFAGYVDGELEPTPEVVRDIVRAIRQVRPDRVVIQSSERLFHLLPASHPDHLAAGEACLRALYPHSGNPFSYPELLEREQLGAWTAKEVWISAHPEINHVVDVTDHVDTKLEALRQHVSQHADPDQMTNRVRGWMTSTASTGGLPEGRCAEAFAVFPCF
jgi:LmbE family N-acetylglucosaminyl deacetylase